MCKYLLNFSNCFSALVDVRCTLLLVVVKHSLSSQCLHSCLAKSLYFWSLWSSFSCFHPSFLPCSLSPHLCELLTADLISKRIPLLTVSDKITLQPTVLSLDINHISAVKSTVCDVHPIIISFSIIFGSLHTALFLEFYFGSVMLD